MINTGLRSLKKWKSKVRIDKVSSITDYLLWKISWKLISLSWKRNWSWDWKGAYLCVEKNRKLNFLSTSIYDLVLIYVCHFHHHFLLQLPLVKFDHYRDTRASILDPCIQGIYLFNFEAWFWIGSFFHCEWNLSIFLFGL